MDFFDKVRGQIKAAVYEGLKKALQKTSWNVKQQRANITPQQAEQRRVKYAQSIGLKPDKNGKTVGAPPPKGYAASFVPAATRNKLPYSGRFGVEHETAHAMMTPEDKTLREYQNYLTTNSIPKGPPEDEEESLDYDPIDDEQDHIDAVGQENTANRMEYGIDRRAGVDPHKFKSKFRDEIVQPIDASQQSGSVEGYFDPGEHGEELTGEAQHYLNRFDRGARFNHLGRVVEPTDLDARINERGRAPRLPGQHLFKKP